MVDGINISDKSQQTLTSKAKLGNAYSVASFKTAPLPNDKVVLSNKNAPKKKQDKLQMAYMGLGALASVGVMSYFGSVLIGGIRKNNNILKSIKKADLPEKIKETLISEYKKLKFTDGDPDNSQKYINEMLKLNGCLKPTEQKFVDVKKARQILDEKIVGHDDVKTKVIEFLDAVNYNKRHGINNTKPLILCLDGPPGTGKTSIGSIIAEAMELPFQTISVAGAKDDILIRGGDRMYKSSAPGGIVQSMQKAGTSRFVLQLDEVDKMIKGPQGDPSAALLGALEPSQNKNFKDTFMGTDFDLSNIVFIATSNKKNDIPEALASRFEFVHIPAYVDSVKNEICKRNVVKNLETFKMSSKVNVTDDAISEIVNLSVDHNGKPDTGARIVVRNVDNVFNRLRSLLEHADENTQSITVDKEFVQNLLKKEQNNSKVVSHNSLDTGTAPSSIIQVAKGFFGKK